MAGLALGPDGLVYAAEWGRFVHALDPERLEAVGSWQVFHDGAATPVDGVGVAPDCRIWAAQWGIGAAEVLELP